MAFASGHNKETAMDTSNGPTGVDTTPGDAARRIKESASTVIERGKDAAVGAAEQGAQHAKASADTAASALRRAADDVEGDNRWISAALRKSAEGLETASRSLSGGDLSHSLDDINGFARRNPAVFLGATFALGFALARVGKTAVERATDGHPEQGV
jgi:hypothetical protein